MAKLTGPIESRRLPKLGGRLLVYERMGKIVLSKWPRRRPEARKHPRVRERMEWFTQANTLSKYVPDIDMVIAHEITRGSPFYPRDWLMALMAGRAWGVLIVDGKRIWPMSTLDDLRAVLDLLGPYDGGLIIRKNGLWQTLQPGSEGDVLTIRSGSPVWAAAPGGAGAAGYPLMMEWETNMIWSTSPYNVKGNLFELQAPVSVVAVTALIQSITLSDAFRLGAALVDTSASPPVISQILEEVDVPASQAIGPSAFRAEFSAPRYVSAGQALFAYAYQPGAGAAHVLKMGAASSTKSAFVNPSTGIKQWARLAADPPQVGAQIELQTGNPFWCWPEVTRA